MCGPTPKPDGVLSNGGSSSNNSSNDGGNKTAARGVAGRILDRVFPVHPAVAVLLYAVLIPSGAYLNRGFTIWFYWASIFQALTGNAWMSEVLAIVGTSICLGWYASIFYEFFYYKLWFEALYKNMPMVLVKHMVREPPHGPCHWDTTASLTAMFLSHFFDLLGHPVLTYHHYRKRRRHHEESVAATAAATAAGQGGQPPPPPFFGWSAILAGYGYSRIWSAVHGYHNFGTIPWYYIGYDVYVLNSLDMWYPAYIAETLWYGSIVIRKLRRRSETTTTTTTTTKTGEDRR